MQNNDEHNLKTIGIAVDLLRDIYPDLTETKLRRALRRADDTGQEEPAPQMINKDDAARILGVSSASVLRLIKAGRLPASKVGAQWRLPYEKIRRIASGEESGPDTEGIEDESGRPEGR